MPSRERVRLCSFPKVITRKTRSSRALLLFIFRPTAQLDRRLVTCEIKKKENKNEQKASAIFSHLGVIRSLLSPRPACLLRSLISILLRESVTRRFNLRNRDRQCRHSARYSTSMTIAGNFVRSVCVLAPLSSFYPPSLPPTFFPHLSSLSPSHTRSHSPRHSSPVRSFISPHPEFHSIRTSEFVREGNLFSVTSPGRNSFRAPVFRTHASP